MAKTNIEHLRDILLKYELEDTKEAIEFLDAIEEDVEDAEKENTSLKDEAKEREKEINSLNSQVTEMEENPNSEEAFVGLDTIRWSLDKGNLKIQMQMEKFIETLQKQNCASAA